MAENFSHFEEIIENKFDLDSEALTRFTWYDVLGVPLYGAYDENKYKALFNYKEEEFKIDKEKLRKANSCLTKLKNTLSNEVAKKAYDEKLKKDFLVRLEELAANLSEKNTLTKTNEQKIVKQGREWKVEVSKIGEITGKYTVIEDTGGSGGTFIPEGTPILELINTATNQPQEEINLWDVKLSSRTTQTFTVKNGGGGYLNATIKTSESWIQISSNKIEQKDLPKNINIIIAPSADKTIENGSIYGGFVNFSYNDGNGGTQTKSLWIEIITEGYERTVKRKSLWAVGIYFLVYLGGNTYLPHLSGLDFIYWWIAAFVLWKAANWFFRWKPLNKTMVLLLPLMFIAGMYFGLKAASKPKDADLKIIPINKIGYMKRKEGVIVLDYPESGKELHRLPYSIPISIAGKDSISGWYKMIYGTEDKVQYGYIPNNSITFDMDEVKVSKKKKSNRVKAKRERANSNLDSTRSTVLESDSI
jgi:hypothetical protein